MKRFALFYFLPVFFLLSCEGVRDQPEVARALQHQTHNWNISVSTEPFEGTDSVHVRVRLETDIDKVYDEGKAMMLALLAQHEARRTGLIAQITISTEPKKQTFSFRRSELDVADRYASAVGAFAGCMERGNFRNLDELLSAETYPNDSLKKLLYDDLAAVSRVNGWLVDYKIVSLKPRRAANGEVEGYLAEFRCFTTEQKHLFYKLRFGKNLLDPRIEDVKYETLAAGW